MKHKDGFTLVEIIIALTVLAVALSGLVSLYGISLELADEARQKSVAAELASTQLAKITASPEAFIWNIGAAENNDLFPIVLREDDPPAGNAVVPPAVLLVNRAMHDRNERFYKGFRWKAWGMRPSPDDQAYEITVSVRWQSRGKQRSLALTSSVPLYRIPEPAATGGNTL